MSDTTNQGASQGDQSNQPDASAAGTFALAGDQDLLVNRIGFGAMRITGQPGNLGWPEDPEGARRLLRRAVEIGVNLIDTADAYGPGVSEELIAGALKPYLDDVVIATKGGAVKTGPAQVHFDGSPEYLREACEASLQRLGLETIDLYQLHWPAPNVPFEESVGALAELREEGKIRHVGLCNVDLEQLTLAREIVPIASVQNRYSLSDRDFDDLVDLCADEEIAFVPYGPLGAKPFEKEAPLTKSGGPLDQVAGRHGVRPAQVALAWLLERSPTIVPIPGTTSVAHLEENLAASSIQLSEEDRRTIAGG